jgi:glucosylceramidase
MGAPQTASLILIARIRTGAGWRAELSLLMLCLAFAVSSDAATAATAGASAGQRAAWAVRVTLTTRNLRHALTSMPTLQFRTARPHVPLIAVNDRTRYQQVEGFGAALTDSSAWLLYDQLSPGARARVLQDLFGTAGIDLNLVRIPIAASDFSATGAPYSYDDLPAGASDPTLESFSIAHDEAYVVPTLREILAVNPGAITLATPWSAPPWMKSTDAFGNLINHGILLPADYRVFADYFVRFIEAYANAGIPITAVTPENEPMSPSAFPAMELDEPTEAVFISQYLAPALAAAGLQTHIYGLDGGKLLAYAQALLSGPAGSVLSGIAWHCYGGMDVMSALHREFPGADQLVSECSPGISPYAAGEVAIDALRNWASAVALWNVALDPAGGPVQAPNSGCRGCTPLVTISELTHAATFSLNYYEFGQVSRFVQQGAVRIGSSRFVSDYERPSGAYGVTKGLDNVAVLNPNGTRVLVVSNNSAVVTTFAIGWRGRYVAYTLAPKAVATFSWR